MCHALRGFLGCAAPFLAEVLTTSLMINEPSRCCSQSPDKFCRKAANLCDQLTPMMVDPPTCCSQLPDETRGKVARMCCL
uniref:Putative secreted protein n=1 Tax=Rhipicephalus microplus TaxID=6941 RepID=A0A6M2DDM5_RHIMP